MRKYLSCMTLVVILFMTGCSGNISEPGDISSVFDGIVNVKMEGKEYECELKHTPEQVNRLEITKPEKLDGLTFTWEGDKYKVIWKELECEFNKDILPQGAFAEAIINALNSITDKESLTYEKNDGDDTIFNGKCPSGDFKVYVKNNGIIKHISIPSVNIEADFITND